MGSVGAAALSGLYANEQRIAVAADNIANVDSPDYNAKQVTQSSNEAGGVTTSVVDRNPPTISVSTTDGGTEQRPNVDLTEQVVEAQVATYSAKADLKVLQVQDKLNKYLVDITA